MEFKKPKLVPDLLFKDIGEEGILLNSNTASYYRVNALGVKVINLILDEKLNSFDEGMKQLAEDCSTDTGVPTNQIHQDLHSFIEQLEKDQIVLAESV